MKSLILSAVAVLAAASSSVLAQQFPLQGQNSGVREARTVVIRSEREWRSLWAEHAEAEAEAAPQIDFSREMIVGVFLGEKSTAGYKVKIVVQPDPVNPSRLFVLYREVAPPSNGMRAEMVSHPYVLVRVKIHKTVSFEEDQNCSVPDGEGKRKAPKSITPDQTVHMDKVVEQLGVFASSPSF